MKILCMGMMVCDTLLSPVPYNILQSDSVSIDKPVICCGGDALNVALGLAKLGNDVSIIGRISDDANGRYLLKECERYKIDTSKVIFDSSYTTAASYALIDEKGERHFLSEKSIFARLQGSDIPDEEIKAADILYLGSAMALREMDAGGAADVFTRAHLSQIPKLTAMDAAINIEDEDRDWLDYLSPAFAQTDIFFPSLGEAVKITGEKEPEKIAECFRQFSMKLFGIKLGGSGCFVTDFMKNKYIECPKNMPVIDTTGAGDSFMAGLLCAVSHGFPVFDAAEFAVCVATKNVGTVGGTAGIADYKESLCFYQKVRSVE